MSMYHDIAAFFIHCDTSMVLFHCFHLLLFLGDINNENFYYSQAYTPTIFVRIHLPRLQVITDNLAINFFLHLCKIFFKKSFMHYRSTYHDLSLEL